MRLIELLAMTCTYYYVNPLLRLFLILIRWRKDCLRGPQGRANDVIAAVIISKNRIKMLRTKEVTAKRLFLALPICFRNTQFIFKICISSVMKVSDHSLFSNIHIHKLGAYEGELITRLSDKTSSTVLVRSKKVLSGISEGTLTLTI